MSRNTAHVRRITTRVALLFTLATALVLSGCVVQSNGNTGVLEVNWTQSVCDLGSTVRIRASRGGAIESEVTGVQCSRRSQSLFVPPGTYTVTIEAIGGNGSVNGDVTATNLNVFSNQTTSTAQLSIAGNGAGEIRLNWTIGGESATTGCAKAGLTTVIVSLLGPTGSTVLSTAQTDCVDGGINLTGVAPGSYRVQLDGATKSGVLTWGNAQLGAAFNVAPGMSVIVQNPIELVDLRAAVSLNWQFSDSSTCKSKNVTWVLVEVRDGANKIVVPMSDISAKKPCDIGPNSEYDYRVIDMQFTKPTCTIPANAKGLIICGITGKQVTVSISTIDDFNGVLAFGGAMKIEAIPAATHTAISTPLYLSPCNNSNNICAQP